MRDERGKACDESPDYGAELALATLIGLLSTTNGPRHPFTSPLARKRVAQTHPETDKHRHCREGPEP